MQGYGKHIVEYVKSHDSIYRLRYKQKEEIEVCKNCGYPEGGHTAPDKKSYAVGCRIPIHGKIVHSQDSEFEKSEILSRNFWIVMRLLGYNPT